MDELLKEVLIKECGNMLHDKVFVVENLPKKFLYEKTVKMIQRVTENGYRDGTMVADPSGEIVETLYPGIEKSIQGDGGFLFWTTDRESLDRLRDIDRYIERVLPRDVRVPKRVPYAQSVGDPNSPPMPYHMIPRVTLPLILPPSASAQPAPSQVSEEPRGISREDEIKEKRRAALEKARAARKSKKEVVTA